MRNIREYLREKSNKMSIQFLITISFTVISIIFLVVMSVTMYGRFRNRMVDNAKDDSVQLLNQTAINLEGYLKNMRSISDAMYYTVIKNKDISTDSLDAEMDLIYEANKDKLVSIACFSNIGELMAASPIATKKANVDVTTQDWFSSALTEIENVHLSVPHIENIYENSSYQYLWVVSLSKAVEITKNGRTSVGVLLVDMNYSSIESLLTKANQDNASEYVYLMDGKGEIIYHPKQQQIYMNLFTENNEAAVSYEEGCTLEEFAGEQRIITVKTIGYTGWKLVNVVPMSTLEVGFFENRMFFIILVAALAFMTVIINSLISARIAGPIKKLDDAMGKWEAGDKHPYIEKSGAYEVAHLGRTMESAMNQINQLMDDIVVEQEEKRISELDALQSQINPHFLYNTLDSIVWMIEGEKSKDAVSMVTELASLFRISLSKGRTIIPISDEVKHAKNYMNIQKVRYKNKFDVIFDVDEEILNYCTVKLILQPLLENAIYYGVEMLLDEGEIKVRGYKKDDEIILSVEDNGLGMPQETVDALLTETGRERAHGSGVGLINIHRRIQLRFGEQYGLEIESEPDEGTIVKIHIPAIEYNTDNIEKLEKAHHKRENGEDKS